jgi:N-acetylglucosamine-6-sulfatase
MRVATMLTTTALLIAGSTALARTTSPPASATPPPNSAQHGWRPNIVLITTDDQNASDMRWMPRTRRLLGDAGVTFTDSISPHPLCCPARAEMLTGQFAQNNGVRTNDGRYGGWPSLDDKAQTIGRWLQDAGYRTMFTGKFLNQYDGQDVAGWDQWHAFVGAGVYSYYDFTVSHNGRRRFHGGIHQADFLAARTVTGIRRFSDADHPFFIWQSHVAPHGACLPDREPSCWTHPVPARRHDGDLGRARPPAFGDPSFNERDLSDKPSYVREWKRMDRRAIAETRRLHVARVETLRGVDAAVAKTLRALRTAGELRSTLVLFTSDNGYLLGEHRIKDKDVPYEPALRVPLLMRGPGVPEGVRRHQQVATVDLAPTVVDAAGTTATRVMDGRSLLPLARTARTNGYGTLLIQGGPRTDRKDPSGWFYRGVRTRRYTFVKYPRYRTELYDRLRDPHQLHNLARDRRYRDVRAALAQRARALRDCSGASCRRPFAPLPRPQG